MMPDAEFERLVADASVDAAVGTSVPNAVAAIIAEARRNRETIKNAPHGALCKRGFKNLYDPGGKCICWKRDA